MIKLPIGAVFLAAALGLLAVGINAESETLITVGHLFTCGGHNVSGEVVAIHEQAIRIVRFYYDGKAEAWIHAMEKDNDGKITKAKGVTLAYPDADCGGLKKEYKEEELHVTLPKKITEYASIGVYSYKDCSNFGHVVIPEDLKVSSVPGDFKAIECTSKPPDFDTPCTDPEKFADFNGTECTVFTPRSAMLDEGNMTMPTDEGSSGAAPLSIISGWFIVSLFLAFGKH